MSQYLLFYTFGNETVRMIVTEAGLIKFINEADFNGAEDIVVYDITQPDKIERLYYKGWQPGCVIQFTDESGEVVVSGVGEDH